MGFPSMRSRETQGGLKVVKTEEMSRRYDLKARQERGLSEAAALPLSTLSPASTNSHTVELKQEMVVGWRGGHIRREYCKLTWFSLVWGIMSDYRQTRALLSEHR